MAKAAIKAGTKIKHYELHEEIGAGGLGRVFRATDTRSNQTVAVKVLHDEFVKNRKVLGIFHRELLIMSGLHHKNILSYLDNCFDPPVCFIVSEFVAGCSISKLLRSVERIPPVVAVGIVFDVLQGIDYLHLRDTVHSDLSSSNVMVDTQGRVLVADFGLACSPGIEDYKNYMVGTPGYFSPEHVTNTAIVPQSDIYCIGLLLYEMITGSKAVIPSKNRQEVHRSMRKINFRLVKTGIRSFDSYLRRFLKKSLHNKVSRRIDSTEEMMTYCYDILKRCGIRYSRRATLQYLVDVGLAEGPLQSPPQPIYLGKSNPTRP